MVRDLSRPLRRQNTNQSDPAAEKTTLFHSTLVLVASGSHRFGTTSGGLTDTQLAQITTTGSGPVDSPPSMRKIQ